MLFTCVRQPLAAVAQIIVEGDVTTYVLDPGHYTERFAGALAILLAGVAANWTRHGDITQPPNYLFRVDRTHDLPDCVPVTCLDEPPHYGYLLSAAHVTEAGTVALDVAAREELRYWSQGS